MTPVKTVKKPKPKTPKAASAPTDWSQRAILKDSVSGNIWSVSLDSDNPVLVMAHETGRVEILDYTAKYYYDKNSNNGDCMSWEQASVEAGLLVEFYKTGHWRHQPIRDPRKRRRRKS